MSTISFGDFSDGLWIAGERAPITEQDDFAVPPGALLLANNLDYLPSGAVRGRRGSAKTNSATQRGGKIVALHRFTKRDESGVLTPAPPRQVTPRIFNDETVGTQAWSRPTQAGLPDRGFASVGLTTSQQSNYLKRLLAARQGSSGGVPYNATITGIEVNLTIRGFPGASDPAKTAAIRLWDESSGEIGTSPTTQNPTIGTDYSDQDNEQILIYGGANDKWGLGAGLTPAVVNDPGFGIVFSASLDAAHTASLLAVVFFDIGVYYTVPTDTTDFLVCHVTGGGDYEWEVHDAGAGTFTSITGGTIPDVGVRPRTVAWPEKQRVFIFDGSNALRSYDGDEITQVDHGPGLVPANGPYATVYRNRLYATREGELSHSVYASDINDETFWPPQLQLSVNDSRGGNITGIEVFGDVLVIFKDTAIFTWTGDPEFGGQLTELSRIGCVSPDSIAVTPFGIVFVGRVGVYLTNGFDVLELSRPIKAKFVDRDNELVHEDAIGVWYERRQQYWLKLDPLVSEGYVLHRVAFPTPEGETEKLAWARIPSLPMNVGTTFETSGDDGDLYIGDMDGYVWQRDVGSQDDGSPFTSEFRSASRLLDNRYRREGRAIQLRPFYRAATNGAPDIFIRYNRATSDNITKTLPPIAVEAFVDDARLFIEDQIEFGNFIAIGMSSTDANQFECHRIDAEVRLRSRLR